MSGKIVLAISGSGANDAIRGMVDAYTRPIADLGLPVVHVSADEAELRYAAEQIANGGVAFAVTWLGIGQYLPWEDKTTGVRHNAWERFQTPLLKIHGDLPAYFQDLHRDVPSNVVNLYVSDEFIDYRKRWMRESRALTAQIPPIPVAPVARERVDRVKRRAGKIIFLKNGNSPAELHRLWQERLPASVARLVHSMAEAITPLGLRPGRLLIGDFVAQFLEDERIEPESARRLVPFLAAQMDDHLRRVKSELVTTALLDLPVVIQGNHWTHVDFSNRRATLRPGQDYATSQLIYTDSLAVIDMSPNTDTGGHERVQRAAGSFAVALTNRQTWITRDLPGFEDLLYEFTPDSISARVSDVISHPDRYIELGIAFGDRFRQVYSAEAYANRIVDLAELAVLHYGSEKPVLQPFFIWPQG